MIDISPEQTIYNRLYDLCTNLGYDVYEYIPNEVEYPLVILGEQFSQNVRVHKDFYNKDTQITIHVWHNNWRRRGTLLEMMRQIELAIVREFDVDGELITSQVIGEPDNAELLHGIIETNIRI